MANLHNADIDARPDSKVCSADRESTELRTKECLDDQSIWVDVIEYPLMPYLDVSWNELCQYIAPRVRHKISHFGGIDPMEVQQDVLIQLCRRSFVKNYNSRKGSMWRYINGTIEFVCLGYIRAWRRQVSRCSPIELACQIAKSEDPEVAAIMREILADIRKVRCQLSPNEQAALPQVLYGVSGARCSGAKAKGHRNYASESRCRARLRKLLPQHALGKFSD